METDKPQGKMKYVCDVSSNNTSVELIVKQRKKS